MGWSLLLLQVSLSYSEVHNSLRSNVARHLGFVTMKSSNVTRRNATAGNATSNARKRCNTITVGADLCEHCGATLGYYLDTLPCMGLSYTCGDQYDDADKAMLCC